MLKRKILLVHLPQWCVEQPPLGIGYLTGYLRSQGYEVDQRDLSIELFSELPKDQKYLLESSHHEAWLHEPTYFQKVHPFIKGYLDRWAKEIASNDSDFIGFTMLSTNRIPTLLLAESLKAIASGKTIIVGGPHVTRYEGGFQIAEHAFVDYVVPDEGEETAFELLESLVNHKDISQVKGILYRIDGKIHDTGQRALIAKINELPIPIFDQFPLKSYRGLTLPILGSRGCIYSCAFCSETVFWRRYRFRTGENLFREFQYQNSNLGARSFYIVDSLINGNVKELEKMCDLIIDAKLEVYWGGKVSIRQQMTAPLLNKMYKAGCRNLDYGVESGSPKVIKDMKKGFDLPLATRVLKDSHESGIEVGVFMLVGFPTESEDDYELSKVFLEKHQQFLHHVTPGYGCGIQKGSDLHENQDKYGITWKDGNWYSEFITPEILQNRIRDFRKFCNTLSIQVS